MEFDNIRSEIDSWFNQVGFHSNPFATVEADTERELLPQFFVEVPGYERIRSNRNVVVFARRGEGKSALRVMLAGQAAPLKADANELAIEYVDLYPLVAKYRDGTAITIEDHVIQILKHSARSLFHTLSGHYALTKARLASLRETVTRINAFDRQLAAQFIGEHHAASAQEYYQALKQLDDSFSASPESFIEHLRRRQLVDLIRKSSLHSDPVAQIIGELCDTNPVSSIAHDTPHNQLKFFVDLANSMGYQRIWYLIDRIDEYAETSNSPIAQVDILQPLLADLQFLETPGVSFKCFLSMENREELLSRPQIRRDRLSQLAITVQWDNQKLEELLRLRLEVYSDGRIHSLEQICSDSANSIVDFILSASHDSPRRMLNLLRQLVELHVYSVSTSGLIGIDALKLLKDYTKQDGLELHASSESINTQSVGTSPEAEALPKSLYIDISSRTLMMNSNSLILQPLLEELVFTLAASKNQRCTRDELREKAWRKPAWEVSDYAIDRAMNRLRSALGTKQLHIRTIRGYGYSLTDRCVIVDDSLGSTASTNG